MLHLTPEETPQVGFALLGRLAAAAATGGVQLSYEVAQLYTGVLAGLLSTKRPFDISLRADQLPLITEAIEDTPPGLDGDDLARTNGLAALNHPTLPTGARRLFVVD